MKSFFVTASAAPGLPARTNDAVDVREFFRNGRRTGFYAAHDDFGCGRNYASPTEAIRGLFASHGYDAVTIRAAD